MKDTDFQPVLDDIVATLRPLLGEHLTLQLVIALAAVAAGIVLVNPKKAAVR